MVSAWTGEVKCVIMERMGVLKGRLKEDDGGNADRLRSKWKDAVNVKPQTCAYVVMLMEERVRQRV